MSAEGTENYESLCKKLDKLAIIILKTLQDIILERKYLDANLQEGYINMAKSRYVMPGQKVNIFQVNENNLFANRKVITCSEVIEGTTYLNLYASKNNEINENNGLKHRQIEEKELSERTENISISDDESKTENEPLLQNRFKEKDETAGNDPLKWFGVLIPEPLRVCQSRFQQATHTALRVASLQNKLKAISAEYRKLKVLKESLAKTEESLKIPS